MFKHRVTIVRPDTGNEFFYTHQNILTDQRYIDMVNTATANGKIISESTTYDGDLILIREVVWVDEITFNQFFEEYLATIYPNYIADFSEYNTLHGHEAYMFTEVSVS